MGRVILLLILLLSGKAMGQEDNTIDLDSLPNIFTHTGIYYNTLLIGRFPYRKEYDSVEAVFAKKNLFIVGKEGKKGIVDINNKNIIPLKYEKIYQCTNDFLWAKEKGQWGIFDFKEKIIVPFIYDDIKVPYGDDGLYAVERNKKWGFINIGGKEIIPLIYEDVIPFGYTMPCTEVMKNNKWGAVNKQGEVIIPFEYNSLQRKKDKYEAFKKVNGVVIEEIIPYEQNIVKQK